MSTALASQRTTERHMLDRLNVRYSRVSMMGTKRFRRYSRAEHVPIGLQGRRDRIADYIAVDAQANGYGVSGWEGGRAPIYSGHEVKVSRADWLTELRDASKADAFRRHMHCWWLVAPTADVVRDDLPDGWGLMVAHGRSLRVVVPAPFTADPEPMPHAMVGALIRAVANTETRLAVTP